MAIPMFPIQRPNVLGAAQVGEQMRSNRLFEQQQALQNQRYDAETQQKQRQRSKERDYELLSMAERAYAEARKHADPAMRDAVIKGFYDDILRIEGPEAVADFSPRFEDSEDRVLRMWAEREKAQKPGALQQKTEYLRSQGIEPTPENLMRMAGGAERAPMVQIDQTSPGSSLLDVAQKEAAGFNPGDVVEYNAKDGKHRVVQRDPTATTPTESAALRADIRALESGAEAAQTIIDYVKESGTSLMGADSAPLEIARGDVIATLGRARDQGVIDDKEYRRLAKQVPPVTGTEGTFTTNKRILTGYGAVLQRFKDAIAARQQAAGGMADEAEVGGDAPPVGGTAIEDPSLIPRGGQPPAPKTAAEYNSLPSGTTYLHPDGETKVKP